MEKSILLGALIWLSSSVSIAQNSCISQRDLEAMAQSFRQFRPFLKPKQTEYCQEDLGDQWFKIGQSLVILKNLKPNEPDLDPDDALTFKAIQEQDWWAYFTKRANDFRIQGQLSLIHI